MSTRQRGPAVSFPAERTDCKKPSLRCWGRTSPTFPSHVVSLSLGLREAGWKQVSDKKFHWCLFTCQLRFHFAAVSEHPDLPEKQHPMAQDAEQNTSWLSSQCCLGVTPAPPSATLPVQSLDTVLARGLPSALRLSSSISSQAVLSLDSSCLSPDRMNL